VGVGVVSVGIVVKDDGLNEVKLSGCVVPVDCMGEDDGCCVRDLDVERKGDSGLDSVMDGDISDVPDIFVYASASDDSELGV
jgi:hypothetical protein